MYTARTSGGSSPGAASPRRPGRFPAHGTYRRPSPQMRLTGSRCVPCGSQRSSRGHARSAMVSPRSCPMHELMESDRSDTATCEIGRCSVEVFAGGDAELGEHVAQVPLDGAGADEQLGGDLLVGASVP